ncbi:carboxypeptidase-like regulatory domain-containing protein [Catenuloplanes indicus]|uniref:Carboxypeptidase regulatory-like domain-containing protein n=1 Tax=Catenuloplanes indicus TaxID=137267 RepID=A0AAE3W2W5_9ACTN|nr:carboxypeptidase-like regulatory domain-containing protein [Catenuloplanes indicus]MDQ0367927.1 hypothetical protein [Catenuloplanes indicus]
MLFVTPASAQADPPELNLSLQAGAINAGQSTKLTVTVSPDNPTDSLAVTVTVFDGVRCSPCSGTGSFDVTLTGDNLAPGQTRSGNIRVTAVGTPVIGEAETEEKSVSLQVKGPEAVQTVRKISGRVVDAATGEGVSGAAVRIQDPAGHQYEAATNGRGTFTFNGSTDRPITPGTIQIAASARDFEAKAATFNGGNGATVDGVTLQLASTKASPSPTPSASASPSASPTATPSADESEASEEPVTDVTDVPDTNNAANQSDDDGGIPWFVVLIGALLVAVGVGTIVLLMIRRKQDREAAEAEEEAKNRTPVGAAAGGFRDDATRIGGAGMGAGGMDDATRITTPISDAPTMITPRSAMDEFPDPYGAPPPGSPGAPKWAGADDDFGGSNDATRVGFGDDRGGNYGGSGGGYGGAAQSGGYDDGYGNDRGGNYGGAGSASVSGGGYGAGGRDGYDGGGYDNQAGAGYGNDRGGYGNDQYDEPTGRYNGGADGYGGQGGGYGATPAGPYGQRADQGGYGAQEIDYGTQNSQGQGGGYGAGQGGYGGGGYGDGAGGGNYGGQGGYGDGGGAGQGGYGAGQGGNYGGQGGYGDRGGYDQGGYDQQGGGYGGGQGGGYPAQQGGGYDQQQGAGYGGQQGGDRGGYDQGGYRDDRGNQQRGDRRIDWMDD